MPVTGLLPVASSLRLNQALPCPDEELPTRMRGFRRNSKQYGFIVRNHTSIARLLSAQTGRCQSADSSSESVSWLVWPVAATAILFAGIIGAQFAASPDLLNRSLDPLKIVSISVPVDIP